MGALSETIARSEVFMKSRAFSSIESWIDEIEMKWLVFLIILTGMNSLCATLASIPPTALLPRAMAQHFRMLYRPTGKPI
jgi:hypothetical protein